MATTTKGNDKTLAQMLGVEGLDSVAPGSVQVKSRRGKQVGEDVLALREVLHNSIKSGQANAFSGVKTKEQRELITRKIRAAASGQGENGSNIKIATLWDSDKGVLYWGEKATVDNLTKVA
jgi:hypothetical protein